MFQTKISKFSIKKWQTKFIIFNALLIQDFKLQIFVKTKNVMSLFVPSV